MKAVNNNLSLVLESAIKESLNNYEANNDGNSLGDLYLHYDDEDAKLSIYDDLENLLNEVQLPKELGFNPGALQILFQKLEQEQFFEKEFITKPFTISLIDENFIVLNELIFIDDDVLKLKDDLWSSLDKELDDFLKELLK